MTSFIRYKVDLRLLAVILLLAFTHKGMARDYMSVGDGGSGVPPTEAVPPTVGDPVTDGFKTSIGITKNVGEGIIGLEGLTGVPSYMGSVVSGVGNTADALIHADNCIEGNSNVPCVKAANSTIQAIKNGTTAVVGKTPSYLGGAANAADILTTGYEISDAWSRGDQGEVFSKSFDAGEKTLDIGISATYPPAGYAKNVADAACNMAAGKSCLKLTVEANAEANAKLLREGIVVSPSGGGAYFSPELKAAFDEERLSKFKQLQDDNRRAEEHRQRQIADKASMANNNQQTNQGFYDVLTTFANTAVQMQQMKKQTSSPSQSSPATVSQSCNKTFSTPDGCHPGHDEGSHPGGCHCG